jgi:phage terminase large subunit-like protein
MLLTKFLPGELRGSQQPTVLVAPEGTSSAGREAVELARSAGLLLDPWQELALEASLTEQADGRWAALEVGLIVPRQNGKGAVLEARELAGLFLFGDELILHSSHEFKTSQEAFRRILALVQNTPELERLVMRVRTAHGEEGIELKSGARLRFVARSSGSARGFSGSLIVLDEAYNLPAAAMAALFPTLSAQPNPQVWYTTSSPPALDDGSEQVRRLKARADSEDPGRLCWLEWSNPVECDPTDPAVWAAANPSLGIRIDPEFVDSERQSLPERVFAVERLGVWLKGTDSSKIPGELWSACGQDDAACDPEQLVFALDMGPDRQSVAVAVSDGTVVEIAEQLNPSDVAAWMVERWERWDPVAVVVDGAGPAASVVPELQAAGLRVVVTGARDFSTACVRLFDAVVSGSLVHRFQPVLNLAAASAKTRKLGDSWAWARMSSLQDISPLVASSLALWGAQVLERTGDDEEEPKSLVAF